MSIIIQNIIPLGEDVGNWSGYEIIMSDVSKNIICKIDSRPQCCEEFGVCINTTLQSYSDFIGSKYYSVELKDDLSGNIDVYYSASKFVIIHTSKGMLTIQLYNEHNGYYPHDVYIQTEHEQLLIVL